MILDAQGKPYTSSPEEQYADAASARRPSGHILIDGRQVADTLQCVHCGGHFVYRKGSGTRRGFCLRCEGITCGSQDCAACVPAERRLDLAEAIGK